MHFGLSDSFFHIFRFSIFFQIQMHCNCREVNGTAKLLYNKKLQFLTMHTANTRWSVFQNNHKMTVVGLTIAVLKGTDPFTTSNSASISNAPSSPSSSNELPVDESEKSELASSSLPCTDGIPTAEVYHNTAVTTCCLYMLFYRLNHHHCYCHQFSTTRTVPKYFGSKVSTSC